MLYEKIDVYIYELQHLIVTTSNISINLRYHISILLLQLIKIL